MLDKGRMLRQPLGNNFVVHCLPRWGLDRKQNRYMAAIKNSSTIPIAGQVLIGPDNTGIKAYYTTVTIKTEFSIHSIICFYHFFQIFTKLYKNLCFHQVVNIFYSKQVRLRSKKRKITNKILVAVMQITILMLIQNKKLISR